MTHFRASAKFIYSTNRFFSFSFLGEGEEAINFTVHWIFISPKNVLCRIHI